MNMDTGNNYRLVSALFLRLLGVIYLIAFFSIATQILGLAGSQGILPFAQKNPPSWLKAKLATDRGPSRSPPVTALLKNNPFPDEAPRYIRVYAFRYEFTDAEERARTGQWWHRQSLGSFSPLPWVER